MPKCGADKRNCTCGYRYQQSDSKGETAVCPQCGKARPCGGQRVTGSKRCKLHGGKSLVGPAHPSYTTGKYSTKWIPANLVEFVEGLSNDEDLLSGLEELRVLKGRFWQLFARQAGINVFEALAKAWGEFERAMKLPDSDPDKQDKTQASLGELNKLIKTGGNEGKRFEEIYRLGQQLVMMQESERRRRTDAQNILTADQAMVFVSKVMNSITKHVKENADTTTARLILAGITADIVGLVGVSRQQHLASGD